MTLARASDLAVTDSRNALLEKKERKNAVGTVRLGGQRPLNDLELNLVEELEVPRSALIIVCLVCHLPTSSSSPSLLHLILSVRLGFDR